MLKVSVYLIAFYLVYSIMLSRDTSYSRNRAFILLSVLSALVFPFVTLQAFKPLDIQFFGKYLSDVFVTASANGTKTLNSGASANDLLQMIFPIYIIGVTLLISKLLIDFVNLLFLIMRNRYKGSRIIQFHGFNTSGFSSMGYIFINKRLSSEEAREIIKHEQNHLKQNHFLDIIFIEFVKAFLWFNPAIYLFDRSLRAIHEYQADQKCLSSGVPVLSYQSLLLDQVFKTRVFNMSNSFSNPSLIKKRMIMMTKKRTSALADLKLIIIVPIISIVFLVISAFRGNINLPKIQTDFITFPQLSQSVSWVGTMPPPPVQVPPSELNKIPAEESKEAPFVVVEEMPMFPGGDAALLKYIRENTQYPANAKEQNIQGRVIIKFCITAEGGVSLISVLKGIAPELDNEAIRVVSTLPAFNPGRQGGKPVPVWYMVPITFSLK